MQARTITTWSEFDQLADDWNRLLGKSGSPSIFLTWEWIRSWRRAIGESVDPYVVVVHRENGDLAGIAPLYLASVRLLHIAEFRMLRFMADAATGAEYPDWIVDAGDEAEICDAIARHLRESRGAWDAIWLTTVSGWAGAEQRIRIAAERNGLRVRARNREFAHIRLPARLSEFESRLSTKSRQRLRRNSRRIREMDSVNIVRCSARDELPRFLDALFNLHQLRWRAAGMDGSFFRQPVVESFYREMAPVALQKGWLWLCALQQGESIKAVQFGYAFNGSYLQLQEGYDPEFRAGAGNALRHSVIERCIEAGIGEYDFLVGTSEHKKRWCVDIRSGCDMLIGNSSWRSRFLLASGAWPTGRFMQQRGLVTGAEH